MQSLLVAAVLALPMIALGQETAAVEPAPVVVVAPTPVVVEPVPAPQPVHAAEPILPMWNIGAGFTFYLGGLSALAGTSSGLGTVGQPAMTVLIERRLNEYLLVTFQAAAGYGASQDDKNSDVFGHQLNLTGTLGLRRIINPRGIVEVSWFASLGLAYGDSESRAVGNLYDSTTGTFLPNVLQTTRGNSFSFGAVAGLTVERELIAGLALRISSSVLGFSYGSRYAVTSAADVSTDAKSHGFDLGLRFSPSIELRYAF